MAKIALSTPAEGSITKGTIQLLFSSFSANLAFDSLFSDTFALRLSSS